MIVSLLSYYKCCCGYICWER